MNTKRSDYSPSLGTSEVAPAVLCPVLVPSVKEPCGLTRRGETSGRSPRGSGDWNVLQAARLPCCGCFAGGKAE